MCLENYIDVWLIVYRNEVGILIVRKDLDYIGREEFFEVFKRVNYCLIFSLFIFRF